MALLNTEGQSNLLSALSTMDEDRPTGTLSVDASRGGSVQESLPVQSSPEEDVKVTSSPDARKASDNQTVPNASDSDDSSDTSHRIPYNRFSKVVAARNRYEAEANEYKQKIADLEAKFAKATAQQSTTPTKVAEKSDQRSSSWLDEFLAEEKQTEQAEPDVFQKQFSSLESRLQKFEVAEEERLLRAELASIGKEYPTVPQELLLKAVIENPDVDLGRFAEAYHTQIAAIEEQAIARYLAQNKSVSNAAPRPKSTGSSTAGKSTLTTTAPKTLKDASKALRQAMHDKKLF
jgi:hypothetical protein